MEASKSIPKQSVMYPPGWEQIGVYMFKKYIDEQTSNLLESYRLMVTLHTQDKALSESYYNEIMKTGAKIAYLYKQGYITKEDLVSLKLPFRKFCSILTNSFRYLSFDPMNQEKIERISEVIMKFSSVVFTLLSPFTNDKGLEKLEQLFNYSKSKEFLLFCFDIPNMDSFKPIIFTLSYYLAEFQ